MEQALRSYRLALFGGASILAPAVIAAIALAALEQHLAATIAALAATTGTLLFMAAMGALTSRARWAARLEQDDPKQVLLANLRDNDPYILSLAEKLALGDHIDELRWLHLEAIAFKLGLVGDDTALQRAISLAEAKVTKFGALFET